MESQTALQQNLNFNQTICIDTALERNLSKEFDSANLKLQIIKKQNSILHYFSTISTSDQDECSYERLLKVIDSSPTSLISFFSSHIFNRVSIWIQKFITMPKEVASIISQFFINDDHLSFFAYITFPSIFHHFITSEFCEYASQLVINMIMNEQRYVANLFTLSYLQSSKFLESLWFNFDSSNPKEDVYTRFLQSVQAANVCFTKSQIKVIITLFEKSRANFGRVIYGRFFWNSYIEFHEGHEDSPLSKMLQSFIIMTRSSQFIEIYEAIITQKYSFEKFKLADYGKINKVPTVLSPHEIFFLQKIAQSSPSVFEYPSNEPKKLMLQNTYENNLKQLHFDLDFTSIFKSKNNQTYNLELFANSYDQFQVDINSTIIKDYCEWANFIVEKKIKQSRYLSLIEKEKYAKSRFIKSFSKFLLNEIGKAESSSSPFTNWINRFYKIDFYSNSALYAENHNDAPKVESKVFKYSLTNHISNFRNKEAKLWIYLRNYAKCDRSILHEADYIKIFNHLKHIKNNFSGDFNNSSFDNIFNLIKSFTNSFPFHDKASTIQTSSLIGIMIKDLSFHFGIPGDCILLKLLSQIHYRKLAEEIIWSQKMLQCVPEIKKLLPKRWKDGLDFIFIIFHNIIFNFESEGKHSNEILPKKAQMESSYSLDDIVKLNL